MFVGFGAVVAVGGIGVGEDANKTGDTYNLLTVLLAAALFVLGIATSFKVLSVMAGMIGIGAVTFLICTIWILTLPVAS